MRMAQALLISRVSLMVGRLAGRLVISGGRITTGTTPEVMGERIACRGMREGCEENNVQFMWEMRGTCGALVGNVFIGCMWGTWGVGEHVGDWGANRDPVAAIHSPT